MTRTFKAYIPRERAPLALGWFACLCLHYPPAQAVRITDTNMLVSEKPCRPNANPNIHVTPPTRPQHEQVE